VCSKVNNQEVSTALDVSRLLCGQVPQVQQTTGTLAGAIKGRSASRTSMEDMTRYQDQVAGALTSSTWQQKMHSSGRTTPTHDNL
jgi:hypothetical protein